MRVFRVLLALTLTAGSLSAEAPKTPEEALKSFQFADDVQVELVAAEPLVTSPCALAFDERGRLFVAENNGYPNTSEPLQGKIVVLEDTDRDGRMDRRTVFADGLSYPNGVLPWKDGLIVTCAPDVFFLRDTDGDGKADERQVWLTGFDYAKSTQLRVNAPTVGPDGWIYLASGLSGGNVTSPRHPERQHLKMTADVRFHPETLVVENVDGRSQYGQSFDDAGRRFICMNRLPVQHVVLSARWLTRNPNLAFGETVQDCSERAVKTGLKGGGDGVRLFPISANITTADSHAGSFSAACGVHIWRGGALPARYDGAVFSCDPTGNLVHVDRLTPRGATFAAEPLLSGHEFLASKDDWFRPVYLTRGPDGALYIADMTRKVIEHPDYLPAEVRKHTDFESGKTAGRIWRITGKTPREVKPQPPFEDEFEEVTRALGDPHGIEAFAHDRSARARFVTALSLGDSQEEHATVALADIAGQDAEDRWARAAILSGLAGREAAFLRAVWPKLRGNSEGELELLSGVARGFADASALGTVVESLPGEKPPALLAALLLGLAERRNLPLTAFTKSAFQSAIASAAKEVTASGTPAPQRLLFVRLLARDKWESAAEALQAVVKNADDEPLRIAALRALVTLDGDRAAEILLHPAFWTGASPAIRETILTALFSRPAQLEGTVAALETGHLPVSALNTARRQTLVKHRDTALRSRAEKLFANSGGANPQALEKAKEALTLKPNPPHGQEIFRNFCATCHRLDREGYAVGPDLLDMRNQPKESILTHIVVPEAEVIAAYSPYILETKDGRTLSGILAAETPSSVTLRMVLAQEETVLRTNIAKLEAMPGSLMPPGLDAAMSKQDLADLLAYLKGEK